MTDNETHGIIILGGLVAVVYLFALWLHRREQDRYWKDRAKRVREQRERVIRGKL